MAQVPHEIEQRVRAHLTGQPQLLFFYSRSCRLCSALEPEVAQVSSSRGIPVSRMCADADQQWAPELLAYSVDKVPCLVLLDRQGQAVARTGEPVSIDRMSGSLQALAHVAMGLRGAVASSSRTA